MATRSILKVKNLRKEYPLKRGQVFTALNNVSFHMERGEILGLLGPNGAGKTTAIQILLGTLKPTSGEISIFGKDFQKYRSDILRHVVFASTYVSLPWKLTVKQNLLVFGQIYGISKKALEKEMDQLLDRFGILEKKNMQVSHLSAGQVTRLVLVKAFMMKPKLVLLDEPTASLDPDIAKEVREFILEQRDAHGTSILFTSHNMDEVAEVCDRTLFLRKGEIIADDLPENLARSVSSTKLKLILSEEMVKRALKLGKQKEMVYEPDHHSIVFDLDESEVAKFLMLLAREGIEYSSIQIEQPKLEDYFLQIANQ